MKEFFKSISTFPDFLQNETKKLLQNSLFLPDIARYEYYIYLIQNTKKLTQPENLIPEIPPVNDFDNYKPFCNPISIDYKTKFPVIDIITSIEKDEYPLETWKAEMEAKYILLYLDPNTIECQFFSFNNHLSKSLYVACKENPISYEQVVDLVYKSNPDLWKYPIEIVQKESFLFFKDCLKNNIILGSLPI